MSLAIQKNTTLSKRCTCENLSDFCDYCLRMATAREWARTHVFKKYRTRHILGNGGMTPVDYSKVVELYTIMEFMMIPPEIFGIIERYEIQMHSVQILVLNFDCAQAIILRNNALREADRKEECVTRCLKSVAVERDLLTRPLYLTDWQYTG